MNKIIIDTKKENKNLGKFLTKLSNLAYELKRDKNINAYLVNYHYDDLDKNELNIKYDIMFALTDFSYFHFHFKAKVEEENLFIYPYENKEDYTNIKSFEVRGTELSIKDLYELESNKLEEEFKKGIKLGEFFN